MRLLNTLLMKQNNKGNINDLSTFYVGIGQKS